MNKNTSILFMAVLMIAVSGVVFGQSPDLSGTWLGETYVPDAVDPDELTLVLKKENGEYTGKLTDSMGMLEESECEDIEFVDNQLTFNFEVDTGTEYLRVYINLKVEGDTMTGFWESEDGSTGEVSLRKK